MEDPFEELIGLQFCRTEPPFTVPAWRSGSQPVRPILEAMRPLSLVLLLLVTTLPSKTANSCFTAAPTANAKLIRAALVTTTTLVQSYGAETRVQKHGIPMRRELTASADLFAPRPNFAASSVSLKQADVFAKRELVERNFHLGIAAGRSDVYSGCYAIKVLSQNAPCRIADNDDGDAARLQILLIAYAFVGS